MSKDPRYYSFSVDLRSQALNQMSFLKTVSQTPQLQDKHILRQALFRYENLWLPLAAKYQNKILAAPLDIEWMWHCHLLSPVLYQQDCLQTVGVIVDHQLLDDEERPKMLQTAHELWRKEYCNRYPFQLDLQLESAHCSHLYSHSKLRYDVIAAAARQSVFFYQVSLPHYMDHRFLTSSELRYRKFLYLKQANPKLFIVPCYDIDLLWHTHQLHPLAYKKDTEAVLGETLSHDDSVTDRDEGSKLYNSYIKTQDLWQKTFNENYSLYGAMYRGDPPNDKLFPLSKEGILSLATKSSTIEFVDIKIKNIPQNGKKYLKVYTSDNNNTYAGCVLMKGKTTLEMTNTKVLYFDTRFVNSLKLQMIERSGFGCFRSKVVCGEATMKMLHIFSTLTESCEILKSLPLSQVNKQNQPQVTFRAIVDKPIVGPIILTLKSSAFSQAIMPEENQSIWGAVNHRPLPSGVENVCSFASHSLVNHTDQVVFTCRVIHSLPLLQSVLHIFYQDKLAAVAQLVGLDTLPLPTQETELRLECKKEWSWKGINWRLSNYSQVVFLREKEAFPFFIRISYFTD